MPSPASASTNEAIGPLPVPTAVRSSPWRRSFTCNRSFSSFSEIDWCPTTSTGPGRRYSTAKQSQICSGVTSPPYVSATS
jgi:hypothetical protein